MATPRDIAPAEPEDDRQDIAPADLITALRAHASWLDRPGKAATDVEGRLDLSRRRLPPKFNLRRARLAGGVFFDADMNGADLSRADLTKADFRNSSMNGVKLNRARCDEAKFYDSGLRDADFTGCKSLNTAQLGGADLTGTTLPAEIAKFELLKTVSEASG